MPINRGRAQNLRIEFLGCNRTILLTLLGAAFSNVSLLVCIGAGSIGWIIVSPTGRAGGSVRLAAGRSGHTAASCSCLSLQLLQSSQVRVVAQQRVDEESQRRLPFARVLFFVLHTGGIGQGSPIDRGSG